MEAELSKHSFLAGEDFSVADIPIGVIVTRWKISMQKAHETLGIDFSTVPSTPNIDRWYNDLLRRPAFIFGTHTPESMHASLKVEDSKIPEWLRNYNKQYNISI